MMKLFAALALFTVANAQQIPNGCTRWNDGCNTCSVRNGRKTTCTEMACFRQGTPKCLAFSRKTTASKKSAMCPNSPMQLCRMMCPPTNCPNGMCAMRKGSCCSTTCIKQPGSARSADKGVFNDGSENDGPAKKQSGAQQGGRCAMGFCEDPNNCPKCASGLRCTPPGAHRPCAGTCYGTCMKKGSPLPPAARPGGGRMIDPGFGRGGH